jgi:2-dehydropantoate 2-reductase
MEILIIGAGAMGGLFGALLAPFAAVSLYTTNAGHAQTINRDGLTLIGMDGTPRRIGVRALTDPTQYGRRADLILLCTKARSTDEAAITAQRLLAEDGLVLTLQNGSVIWSGSLRDRAIAGHGRHHGPGGDPAGCGQVRHAGSGPTILAANPGQAEKIAAIAGLFNRAGIDTRIAEDGEACSGPN